jgi:hypothetical protein
MEEPVDYADREGKTIKPCFPEDSAHQFKQWTVRAANASLSQFDSGQPENGPEFVVGAQQVGFVHW